MVMECSQFREAALEVLYGEAEPDTVRRLEQHLEGCAGCRDEMSAFRSVRRQLSSYTLPVLDPPSRWPRAAWRTGLAAAAALALALGGALVHARVASLESRLVEQEQRHGRELAALRAGLARTRPAADSAAFEAALLPRVQELLKGSEERQAQRLDDSLRQLAERSEAQRRLDLARVRAGLSYLDGRSGQQAARTTQLMGYVLQAAERK
jgi:hypothetical protein